MNEINQTIHIDAAADAVFGALSRVEHYRGWWCQNSAVADWEGGECLLHFLKDGVPVSMRFRVDELTPGQTVRWTCVANDAPPWVGTALAWNIEPAGEGVDVHLRHTGWSDGAPPPVAEGWMHFTQSLKSYLETGAGQPW